jgi:alkylation response protein AidB-like acyl-CoA dehydrogenase
VETKIDEVLLARAEEVGPTIGEELERGEEARRLTRRAFEALGDAGLLRMYVPRSLGGLEVDPVTCAQIIERVSGYHSAAGWALMVANAVAWWCARLPADGVEEIYAKGPDSFVATAFHPPVSAVEVDGGYRLSGRAPLASNVHDASWVMLTAIVSRPSTTEGPPDVIAAVFSKDEVQIIDTWRSLGMRATDSNDVEIQDVFVPQRRTFKFALEFEANEHYLGTLYRAPALGPALAPWATVALAVASNAVREFRVLAQRKTPFVSTTVLRERSAAQGKLGRAEALVRSARLLLYSSLGRAWEQTVNGKPSSLQEKADLLLAAVHTVNSCAAATELMYSAAGTTAIYVGSPIERHFRDIQVLKQHGFMSENRYETAAQVYLGLEPDLALVAF